MQDQVPADGSQASDHLFALRKGTRLFEFEIESILGHGGFGITYRAVDTLLREDVAIKEYLPNELAVRVSDQTVKAKSSQDNESFASGLEKFLEEARTIARFRHRNIMQVRRFFELHGTGYIVLEYEKGQTLSQRIASGPIDEAELRPILDKLLDGLGTVHDRAILHRDLKPNNIIIRDDGSPVLIDFGAARDFTSRHSRSVTAIAAPGYSPPEQYGVGGQQGPWSDLYALGAVLYRCVTGAAPADSLRRLRNDPVVPAVRAAEGKFSPAFLQTIDWMLQIEEAMRPQSVDELRTALRDGSVPTKAPEVTTTGVRIHKTSDDRALLELDKETKADILDIAFRATPPGNYLQRSSTGKITWSDTPQYLSLDRETVDGRTGYLVETAVFKGIKSNARVEVSSSDGFIRSDVDWPSTGVVDEKPRNWLVAALVLLAVLVVTGAAAMNIDALGDLSCTRLGFCTADRTAFSQVETCVAAAAAKPCDAATCTTKFKTDFATSRLVSRVTDIESRSETQCRSNEDQVFRTADNCAQQRMTNDPCGIATTCFSGFSVRPNTATDTAAKRVMDRARDLCNAQRGGTAPVVIPPRPPETPAADAAASTPPVSIPSYTPPPPPPVALANGWYTAVQSYTGSKASSDPRNCPPRDSFSVEVQGGRISYSRPDFLAGAAITRRWSGSINQTTGDISVMGSEASPPTRNALTIVGRFDDAVVTSNFCGTGSFRIQRR